MLLDSDNRGWLSRFVAIISLFAMLSGAFVWADSRYAHSEEVFRSFEEIKESIGQLRCQIIREQLNELSAKKRYGRLTEYDKVARDSLVGRWQTTCVIGGYNG